MQSRREFLRNVAILSGGTMLEWGMLQGLVERAYAIEAAPGTTFLDAEHVVILMQENRSFDHAFGTLQGVRGYNDPRAITLANGHPVWAQSNAKGATYAPFRLNMKDTKATWMSSLPHTWYNQTGARNDGKYDKWLDSKRSRQKAYADMPLTMGYYDRRDIPFYYSLADAFTICDQHFCSSITGTVPNRLYFMTGTVRDQQAVDSPPILRNGDLAGHNSTKWITFPERLEDNGISWRIYQNELSKSSGLSGEEREWLANFGCNTMESFPQYNVGFARTHMDFMKRQEKNLPAQIEKLKAVNVEGMKAPALAAHKKKLAGLESALRRAKADRAKYNSTTYEKLSQRDKDLHKKAFTTNSGDPNYRELTEISFKDGDKERRMKIPKGDIMHQFREDVNNGTLPTVSWLIPSQKLSDHPASAWYGAWYVSEALRILTDNPEVWKKTILILTYDENDGYYDHVPPFVAPHPKRPETGFTSKSIDATLDYAELEQDKMLKPKDPREGPIGLGYRVPMVVASPWSRGGCVCSEVLDNTSILMFLEKFLSHKTGKDIKDTNITSWRRAVCGDMTSLFQPAADAKSANPDYVDLEPFAKVIYDSQFKPLPSGFKALTPADIEQMKKDPGKSEWQPRQERGIRRSSPSFYELHVLGKLSGDSGTFTIEMSAGRELFGAKSLASPFTVYARDGKGGMTVRNYAVAAGDTLKDSWKISDFLNGQYQLEVHGPNGYYREFSGNPKDPALEIGVSYIQPQGDVEVRVINRGNQPVELQVSDLGYKTGTQTKSIQGGDSARIVIDTQKSHQWYDFGLKVENSAQYSRRFAGRVETGRWSYTDPAMGGTTA
ncbi:phospholipase C, phosphocholine-specific [Candidatus Sumerlaeota bacterium]|nr:phospholipase C, phosphocholine-specific [Candidatus Sumerlaeota bacterium]